MNAPSSLFTGVLMASKYFKKLGNKLLSIMERTKQYSKNKDSIKRVSVESPKTASTQKMMQWKIYYQLAYNRSLIGFLFYEMMRFPFIAYSFAYCSNLCNRSIFYSGGNENVNCKVRNKLISGAVVFEQECIGILNATAFKDFWLTW